MPRNLWGFNLSNVSGFRCKSTITVKHVFVLEISCLLLHSFFFLKRFSCFKLPVGIREGTMSKVLNNG